MKTNAEYVLSDLVKPLKQSGIRSASKRCAELGGINLGQGMCDIPAHDKIKQAAQQAITTDKNLYAPHQGVLELRTALAKKIKNFNQVEVDPEREILVSVGSTGAYVSAIKTLFNPGDEIILFEPFYGYHKNVIQLLGMNIKVAEINPDDFSLDFAALEKLIGPKTKGIVVCTPCNPCGKVFTKEELTKIGELAKKHDMYVITDEIYEYITYPGHEHVSLASLADYGARTVTISGFSKTYNVTGWRLGYAYGPAAIMEKMALVHDLLYICPPTPLQHAMVEALALDEKYYQQQRDTFLIKRNLVVKALREFGCKVMEPQGAYYLMVNCEALGFGDDVSTAATFLEQAKVAVVPGRSFYDDPKRGENIVRVCYALHETKLAQAMDNLRAFLAHD